MTRLLVAVCFLGLAGGQDDAALRARLSRFRKLAPEQKQKLRERVEQLKGLAPEERRRLGENLRRFREMPAPEQKRLREKLEKLPFEERRAMVELGAGFFRWAHQQGYADGFPRDVFFAWLKSARRPEMERLRAMGPGDRKDAFLRLFHEFRNDRLKQFVDHARRHGCVGDEEIRRLRDLPVRDFWPRLHEMWLGCKAKPPRRPK